MKASILDLRRHMREILNALDLNETVTLTYRGKDKAIIIPSNGNGTKVSPKNHPAFGLWQNRKGNEVDAMVRKIRRGRGHAV